MPAVERVVLLGFMGAGKTAVGAALARELGWRHVDLDREIERREGRTVAQIFAADGEPAFRELEARVSAEIAPRSAQVFSPGGGWITTPGMLERLPPGSLSVWLQVSVEEAVRRAGRSGAVRPLLRVDDPAAAARRLLIEREPLYRAADVAVRTDGRAVEDIVAELLAFVRRRGAPAED